MEQLPPLGRSIWEVIPKTLEIYGSLLNARSKDVTPATNHETASYGPDARQKLDIYDSKSSTSPILMFLYGGAWVTGDRVLEAIPNGLVYRNLGHYFAGKHGFGTIIPDYRLVKHGALYPSGAEDIALALEYVRSRLGEERPLFLLGNSAGGVNTLSWLLDDQFQTSRLKSKVTGVISLGALMDFEGLSAPLTDILAQYFGKEYVSRSPLAQLRHLALKGTRERSLPALLVLWSELDPDIIIDSNQRFKAELEWNGLHADTAEIRGHNHISPPLALGTGQQAEEEWGVLVAAWIQERNC